MKRNVLFIDDEVFFAQPYLEELESAFTVHVRSDVIEGIEAVRVVPDLAAAVVDVMMPPPAQVVYMDLEEGLNTGLWFLQEVRAKIEGGPMPVVVLTNRNTAFVMRKVEEMKFRTGLVEVGAKIETPRWLLKQVLLRLTTPGASEQAAPQRPVIGGI